MSNKSEGSHLLSVVCHPFSSETSHPTLLLFALFSCVINMTNLWNNQVRLRISSDGAPCCNQVFVFNTLDLNEGFVRVPTWHVIVAGSKSLLQSCCYCGKKKYVDVCFFTSLNLQWSPPFL